MRKKLNTMSAYSICMALIAAIISVAVVVGGNPWLLIALYWIGVAGYWVCK